MTCAILIPSLNRPQRLVETITHIRNNTPEPHRLLFCVSDDESKVILDGLGEWYLDDSDSEDRRYVTRMNKLVRHIGDAETIFFGSDDVVHLPGWLSVALQVMREGHALVVVNDLHNANGTQALMLADYLPLAVFDAPGDAFHGGYHHNYADNEQHFTAFKHNEYARAPQSFVEHLHPIFQSGNALPWDKTYLDAQAGWEHDRDLFSQRVEMIEAALI